MKDSKGETIIGAGVIIKGTTIGGYTDANGLYQISNVQSGVTLVVSCLGYQAQEIVYAGQSELNIVLSDESELLDVVVIAGMDKFVKAMPQEP